MPNTTFDIGSPDHRIRRQYGRRDAPNHNRPWSSEDEDELLRMFADGNNSIDQLASFFGRTTGSINGRLARLLGIAWPETPAMYRASGRPIRRRGQHMPQATPPDTQQAAPSMQDLLDAEARASWISPPSWRMDPWDDPAFRSNAMQQAAPPLPSPEFLVNLQARPARVRRPPVHNRVEESRPPSAETPENLNPAVALSKKHYEALAAELKALRPPFEGKVAAAQHSILNRMAYRMAKLFEGENTDFDRAKWLTACGVTSTQEGN
jgi:hypothetical protein